MSAYAFYRFGVVACVCKFMERVSMMLRESLQSPGIEI